jgi:hypothetical protein
MATITSVTNFIGAKNWNDTTAWQGGVVPIYGADSILIRGLRTTINQSAINYWAGTQTITVSSTSGFPANGSFFTVTDRSQKLKINYTGTTATTFTGCSVDTTYFPWTTSISTTPWTGSGGSPITSIFGGTIPNGAFVHFSPIIEITSSNTTIGGDIIIENGGYLKIYNSGSLTISQSLAVRDGTFHISGSGSVIWGLNNTNASSGTTSRIFGENFQLSQIIFEGDENRTNTTITTAVSIGDGKVSAASSTGFGVNDTIIFKDPNFNLYRIDDGFRVAESVPSGSMDEVFTVTGISGNDLYLARINGIRGPVLAIPSANQIVVDTTQFQVGDKIVANNNVYTITAVSDYDHLLKDYDFKTGTTNLSEWETNITRSSFFADFRISPSPVSASAYALIQTGSTSYRQLFVKDIMRQEVKVEAWISNFRNVTSGTSDGGALGVVIHADPIVDGDYGYDSFARTYFEVDADNSRYRLLQRLVSNDSTILLSRAGIASNGLKKYTLDCRRGIIKGYIDDNLVNESYMRSGGYYGRVGVYCNNQNSFTCLQYKIYATAQLLTLSANYVGNANDMVYETGAEFAHKVGDRIIKQAASINNPLGNFNLAYGYRGASDVQNNSIFPYIYNATNDITTNTRNTNSGFYSLLSGTTNYDVNTYNFGNNVTGSMILDLTSQQTFTHVSLTERFSTYNQYWATGQGLRIQTSNDLSSWTNVTLRTGSEAFSTTSLDNRRRGTGDSIRIFELSSAQTAQYIRFTKVGNTTGNSTTQAENRWMNIGVWNFSDGFKLELSSVSDYSVGDEVMIMYNGPYVGYIQEADFYTNLLNGTIPSSSYNTDLKDYYTITAVDSQNKTITLDRPFVHGPFLKGGERLIKLNKKITLSGAWGTNTWRTGRWNTFTGVSNGRKYIIKNTAYEHMSAQYPINLNSNYDQSAFGPRNYNLWDSDIYDGVSYYNCFTQGTSFTGYFSFSGGTILSRDSYWSGWNGRGWRIYFPNQYTAAYHCGNYYLNCVWTENAAYSIIMNYYNNYNFTHGAGSTRLIPSFYGFYSTTVFLTALIAQFKRNYNNGGQYAGFIGDIHQGNGYYYIVDFADNMVEYMDDYIIENYRYIPYWHYNIMTPKNGNFANRLTRFRNEGFISPSRNVTQHSITPHFKNYMKWGYDLTYNDYSYITKNPNETFFRVYRVNTEWRNALLGTMFYISNNSTASFNYSFEYRHDVAQWSLNANTYTGSLARFVLRDGARYMNDLVLPKVTGSFAFHTGSITVMGPGAFNIGLGQSALNGYVDIQNIKSSFISTDPANFRILNNNMDQLQWESPYNSNYTSGQYIINIDLN